MPCQLPDGLNCVSDDVFSYMCSLAMEKCSKKSEKKKASCGGAAMRKRLLIKNFVAQMLAQDRQNAAASTTTYSFHGRKYEYESSEMEQDGSSSLAGMNGGHGMVIVRSLHSPMEMMEDDENGEMEEEEEEEEDCIEEDESEVGGFSSNSHSSIARSSNFRKQNDEENDGDDEDEEDDDDYEGEEDNEGSKRMSLSHSINQGGSSLQPCSSTTSSMIHHHSSSYHQLNSTSPSSNSAASLMPPIVPCSSGVTSLYSSNNNGSIITTVGDAHSSTTLNMHFYDSMTAATSSGAGSGVVGMMSGKVTAEWEDFHTVPPSRDYLFEDDASVHHGHHSDGNSLLYAIYPPYSSAVSSEVVINSNSNCSMISPTSHHHLMAVTSGGAFLGGELTEPSTATAIISSEAAAVTILPTTAAPHHHHSMSVECANSSATTYGMVVDALPDNFLDETSSSAGSSAASLWEDKCNNNNTRYGWDSNATHTDINMDSSHGLRKPRVDNASMSGSGTVILPIGGADYDGDGDGVDGNATNSADDGCSHSALHNLVTLVPPMIKLGSCRSEYHHYQYHQDHPAYRRSITDLDTNITVVEEDRANGVDGYGDPDYHTFGPPTGDGCYLSPRKRPFAASPPPSSYMDDGSGGVGTCNLMMLTTSPKRVKL